MGREVGGKPAGSGLTEAEEGKSPRAQEGLVKSGKCYSWGSKMRVEGSLLALTTRRSWTTLLRAVSVAWWAHEADCSGLKSLWEVLKWRWPV